MAHHVLEMPVTEAQVRALRIDDTVTLERTLFGIRDATQIAHVRPRSHARASICRATRSSTPRPTCARCEPAPSTRPATRRSASAPRRRTRMERFTRPLMERDGVRLIIGKGGLRDGSSSAFARPGRRLSGDRRRHRGAGNHLDRSDRGRGPGRPQPGIACGAFASATSGRCSSRWTAMAAACTATVQADTAARRALVLASLGVKA